MFSFFIKWTSSLTSSNVCYHLLRHGCCLFLFITEVSQLSSRLTSESRIYADKAKDLNRQVSCNFGAKTFYLHLKPWSLSDCILVSVFTVGVSIEVFLWSVHKFILVMRSKRGRSIWPGSLDARAIELNRTIYESDWCPSFC